MNLIKLIFKNTKDIKKLEKQLCCNSANSPTISSGIIAPTSTPGKIGDIYIDIIGQKLYFAVGSTSSADWIIAN